MPTWTFRPSALQAGYKKATISSLFASYMEDGNRAYINGWSLPNKDTQTLRTCQWNIHFLEAPWLGRRDGQQHALRVADELLQVDADVLILNEIGIHYSQRGIDVKLDALCQKLEEHGHTIYCANSHCPTAIATRLSVKSHGRSDLDADRSAVRVEVETASHKRVFIYGTHLEVNDVHSGRQRQKEVQVLLHHVAGNSGRELIVGDFNQQRQQDYSDREWKEILRNKERRGSPPDDGVASALTKAGFTCCYDQEGVANCNWIPGEKPPATHWSSTVIDYAYSRGGISLQGIHVSPSNLSDHRMIVCDWKLE